MKRTSHRNKKYTLRIVGALLVVAFLGFAPTNDRHANNEQQSLEALSDGGFTAVDRYNFIRMFRPKMYFEDGHLERTELKAIHSSPVGLQDSKPEIFLVK